MSTARVIGVYNRKGGVGKTTTVANLAALCALEKKRVAVIDLDPEANLTQSFRLDSFKLGSGIDSYLAGEIDTLDELVRRSPLSSFKDQELAVDVIASRPALAGWTTAKDTHRQEAIDRLGILIGELSDSYDVIFVDSAPGANTLGLLTLMTVSEVLVPTEANQKGYDAAKGALAAIANIQAKRGGFPRLLGILLTVFQKKTVLHKQFKEFFSQDQLPVLEVEIPKAIAMEEDITLGELPAVRAPKEPAVVAYRKTAASLGLITKQKPKPLAKKLAKVLA